MFSWCNAQDLVSKYLPGCGAVTAQRVLNTTWNQSAFSSLGTLAEDGEKQKGAFRHISTGRRRTIFPEHVRRDRVEMVLAPDRVGQRLHKTSDRNLKCFTAFVLCSLSRRFTQIRMVSKREAERFSADYWKLIHIFLQSFKHQAGSQKSKYDPRSSF